MIKKLFYFSNLVFLLLYFVLAWHNRLVNDDFHYITNLHRYGIIKGTEVEYNYYSTRWLSVLVVHSVLSLMPYINALFLFSFITIIAIIFSFYYLLKNILYHFLEYHPGKFLLLNFSIFCVNAFFYSSIDIGTIWFWLSALPTYLWSFIFFSLGCGIILSSKKFPVLKYVILCFSFFYIGGSAEAFAAVVLLLLVAAFISVYFFSQRPARMNPARMNLSGWRSDGDPFGKITLPDKKIYLLRLCLAVLFCLGSLIVLYVGHGNIVRRGIIGKISLLHALILNVETTGWIGLYWISRILPVTILFSLPLLYAGHALALKNAVQKESISAVCKKIFMAVLLYGLLLFIINYPVTYLLCGISPARALIAVSFLTWALFAFGFFYTGFKTSVKEKLAKYSLIFSLSLCLLLNISNTVQQYIVTLNYANAYDALMKELISKKNSSEVIEVSPLPNPGMLPPINISEDSTTHNNMFIKQSLRLKADIMLKR